MLNEIIQDILWPGLIALCAMIVWTYSVSIGILPPINGVAALKLDMAQYEAVAPEFMADRNKD